MTPPRNPDAGQDLGGPARLPRPWFRVTATILGASLAFGSLAACAKDATSAATTGTGTSSTGKWGDSSVRTAAASEGTVWDSSTVHTISVEVDEDEYAAMLETFVSSDEKDWITATVTIDGQKFSNVGLRLKGNSSLRSVSTTDSEPQDLPWLIRLDKFTDGQDLDGSTDFVVRSSSTQTSLNEAVALELLDRASLATQEAIATRFSVNGSAETLRLTIENPDDAWDAAEFGTDGILYKAEADGDYSYRGDDPESYVDVFDQETGEDNLEPLIEFLQFISESDDATFAAELSDHLDVDAFATYLAMQDLVDNFDDIDGPGNNSYLRYDTKTGAFTVVNWDLNLAFGQMPTGMGGGAGGGMGMGEGGPGGAGGERPELPDGVELPGGNLPEGMEPPTGERPGGAGGPGGAMGRSNILATRFLADADFKALYNQAVTDLTASLYTSGDADKIVSTWANVLTDQASDLVDAATIESEAASLRAAFST
ncbi:Spore coat protein CotH [Sanguibacter gelidistatuariae]|uniref:Spore coat protein CotH n=1 Tax=Sanguibacter gelidistatuariae TaxID=1814289 RepID=A0A1G6RWS1_9MICO|nr:CotH kinase family protein [Sanguibacter gelidistatuariae]SDD08395.1 Spore coat protein CotH [Sanguibacter gelidistatuariae]